MLIQGGPSGKEATTCGGKANDRGHQLVSGTPLKTGRPKGGLILTKDELLHLLKQVNGWVTSGWIGIRPRSYNHHFNFGCAVSKISLPISDSIHRGTDLDLDLAYDDLDKRSYNMWRKGKRSYKDWRKGKRSDGEGSFEQFMISDNAIERRAAPGASGFKQWRKMG